MSEQGRWLATGPEATEAFGEAMGRKAVPGLLIALCGPLGAGKTTLVRGLARGLDVPPDLPVSSPTFALVQHYPGRLPLIHVDLYRLAGPGGLRGIDADDWLDSPGVVVVEWADRAGEALPRTALWCTIQHRNMASRIIECRWDEPLPNMGLETILGATWVHEAVSRLGSAT